MDHYSGIRNIYGEINGIIVQNALSAINNPLNFKHFPLFLKIIFSVPLLASFYGLYMSLFYFKITANDKFLVIIVGFILLYILFLIIKPLFIENHYVNLADINILLFSDIKSVENIESILKKIETISYLFKYKFYYLLDPRIIPLELHYFILLLTDLRSDLSIRLAEQQQSLECAKSEVEKNITGTTELNKVSELQRARLDRQIEQFEELQRVLIKV